ncbi:unnamed protein product [Calicophoron daubneyi]|uniref:Uncharacterized protein n=1 Tax=Calicophoron daubneyi TaxID=300641 RepID=A0AAV2TGE0_CALDB
MSLTDLPLIGRRISIISKAKIRYEGYLHSVDSESPNEPVITLSKVWSFGTEDRPCERPVAPRNEEYNQVVFRGRDLEDIKFVDSSVFLNEDSAIVSAAPGTAISRPPGLQPPDASRGGESAAASFIRPHHSEAQSRDRLSGILSGTCESVSTAPPPPLVSGTVAQNASRPTASAFHMPVVASRPGPIGTFQTDSKISDPRGPRPFGDGRSEGDPGAFNANKTVDLSAAAPPPGIVDEDTSRRSVPGSSSRFDGWDNRDYAFRNPGGNFSRGASAKYGSANAPVNQEYFRGRRGGFYNQWSGQQRGDRYLQGNYCRRGARSGGNYGWSRMHTGVPAAPSEPATFSGEYDYVKANAELAAELEKINISAKSGSSNDGDASKGDESGESAAGDDPVCYDQGKSFFDTLSSELMDKANGISSQNMNRRDQRVLNSATFGAAASHFPRRGGYGSSRSGGSYGNYGYGQRRGGGFWRPGANSGPRNPALNSAHPLSTVADTS